MTGRWRRSGLALFPLVAGCLDAADAPFPTAPAPPFSVVDSSPSYGDTGVATDVIIEVRFSDVPYPPQLDGTWLLSTPGVRVTGTARVDLVERSVRVRAARGLQPYLEYTLAISTDLRSFAGAPLKQAEKLLFFTGGGPGPPPPPPTLRKLGAEVLPALAVCAASGCHASATGVAGLDLESAAGVLGAVSRSARGQPDSVLIVPGSSAASYLLWKALGLAHTFGHRTPALAHDPARVLADWIEQGAQNP
ncbi:MAG TPA: Ig-like domain-containing protein [Polyangia bacterium]|nr:Ig-like domain-containing protein [Polyangia bacterium]